MTFLNIDIKRDEAEELYAVGYYKEALNLFLEVINADPKDDVVQYHIGLCFEKLGDYSNAFIWYDKSASNRNINAIIALADSYLNGVGVEKDSSLAKNKYLLSLVEYINNPDFIYEEPITRVLDWCKNEALQGDVESQLLMGEYYFNVFNNVLEAKKWFTLASENGSEEARIKLSGISSNTINIEDDDLPF